MFSREVLEQAKKALDDQLALRKEFFGDDREPTDKEMVSYLTWLAIEYGQSNLYLTYSTFRGKTTLFLSAFVTYGDNWNKQGKGNSWTYKVQKVPFDSALSVLNSNKIQLVEESFYIH